MSTVSFRVNEPAVVYEVFDGEVVVVNLDNGNYYSLEKVAADLWNVLLGGESQAAIIESAQRRYQGAASEIAAAVESFLVELQSEGLISPLENAASGNGSVAPELSGRGDGLPPFEAPVLSRFTDMQELLLLDPIHEVDETGWPHVKTPEV